MGVFAKIGLGRPELRAWAMYDWANSVFITTVVSALFPPYFAEALATDASPEQATGRLALATTIALAIIAVASPLLGAIADRRPVKKRLLAGFTVLGAGATLGLATVGPGDWMLALVLFGLGNIAANGAFVFYDALLPHVARPDELNRVSTAGYALGYFGGGLFLALNAAMILAPATFGLSGPSAAVSLSFALAALWWLVFALPLLRRIPEPPVSAEAAAGPWLAGAASDLLHTFRELRRFRQAALLLLAFLLYNDGIGTIYRMATAYGKEIGLGTGQLITALLIVQFVGIPATFAFGPMADRLGPRRVILAGLVVYGGVSVLAYFMTTALHFFLLAGLVGLVQGGTQAISRSLFASMIPRARSSEFFGLFAVFEKFAGILGPGLFALMIALFGSSRPAIFSLIGFFVVGGALLLRVDIAEGQRAAAEANAAEPATSSG